MMTCTMRRQRFLRISTTLFQLLLAIRLWAGDEPASHYPPGTTNEGGALVLQSSTPPSQPDAAPAPEPTMAGSTIDKAYEDAKAEIQNLRSQLYYYERRHNDSINQSFMFRFLLILTLPAAFATGVVFARYRNYQLLNRTVRHLIEKGVAVPPEFLTPGKRIKPDENVLPKEVVVKPPMSDLRKGVLCIIVGIAMMLFFAISVRGGIWGLGIIPLFTGIGYLIMWRLDQRERPV